MSRLLSIVSAVALFAVSTSAYADVNINSNNTNANCVPNNGKKEKPFFEQGMPLKDDKVQKNDLYPAAYLAPACIMVNNSWDISANMSFLYWHMGQDAMDLAFVAPTVAAGGTVVYQSQAYKPGFQVGLGMNSGYDGWSVDAEYTWFHNSRNTNVTVAGAALSSMVANALNVAVPAGPGALAANWKLHLDQLDLVGGRPVYHSRNVTVSPNAGLRALWIRQNESGTLGADSFNVGSRSWALGVVGNVNTRLHITRGFRIDGIMGSSLLFTRYTTIFNGSTLDGDATYSVVTNRDALRPTMDAGLGFGFGSYLMNGKFYVDLAARYDFNFFWSQNMMRNFASQLNGTDDAIGDLALHGLTLNLSCDF